MQNKLITLTATAAMAGMAIATGPASNAGQNTKTVYATTTSTASICPASAAGLPEVTVTSTIVVQATVEAADCGPATTTVAPLVTETKTITATSEPSASSKLSSNEVGPTTGDVLSTSSSQLDSTVHLTSTLTATALSTVSTVTSTRTNTKTIAGTIYPIPANSSSILGTGTGALPPLPSGTGAYPSNSITPFTGGAAAVGMSRIVALAVMAAGALCLF